MLSNRYSLKSGLPAGCADCAGLDVELMCDCALAGCPFSIDSLYGGAIWSIEGQWQVGRGIRITASFGSSAKGIEA